MIHANARVKGVKFWFPELSNIGDCQIGAGTTVHSHVWISDGVVIGKNCWIEAFTFIPKGVVIGNDVFVGPRVTFTNDRHPPAESEEQWQSTIVEDHAVIGAGAIIMPGITIYTHSVIGAGSLVLGNVPGYSVVVGSPARAIRVNNAVVNMKLPR